LLIINVLAYSFSVVSFSKAQITNELAFESLGDQCCEEKWAADRLDFWDSMPKSIAGLQFLDGKKGGQDLFVEVPIRKF
jgi:hypothetical protein